MREGSERGFWPQEVGPDICWEGKEAAWASWPGRALKTNFAQFTIGKRLVLVHATSFINKTVLFMVNQREEETTGAKDEQTVVIPFIDWKPILDFASFCSIKWPLLEYNFYFLVPPAPVAFGPNVYDRWARLCLHHLVVAFLLQHFMPLSAVAWAQWACVLGKAHVCIHCSAAVLRVQRSQVGSTYCHHFSFLPGHCPSKYSAQ